MKKKFLLIACVLLIAVSLSSCFRHRHHFTSVTISDSGDEYEMCASYDRNKTHKIQRLLDRELDIDLNNSWGTRHADRVITLDDQTTFHLRSFPGELRISVDKRENQDGSFDRIKDVCEDIKEALGKN